MIDKGILDEMFRVVGLEQSALHAALMEMGASYSDLPKLWKPERPTIGYGAVVSEMVYCYFPLIRTVIPIAVQTREGTVHRVLGFPLAAARDYPKEKRILASIRLDNQQEEVDIIIDLTADQIDEPFNYHSGARKLFTYPSPSKRAQLLAKLLGRDTIIRRGDKWK